MITTTITAPFRVVAIVLALLALAINLGGCAIGGDAIPFEKLGSKTTDELTTEFKSTFDLRWRWEMDRVDGYTDMRNYRDCLRAEIVNRSTEPSAFKSACFAGKLVKGMDMELVLMAWGWPTKPSYTDRRSDYTLTIWQWSYSNRTERTAWFINGRLSDFSDRKD